MISDQYEAVTIATTDGRVVTGRIVNLNGDNMMISPDMLDPNRMINVKRAEIEEITPSPVSMMPEGLLNTLKEDEVLDLMAYLLSRGDRQNPMFARRDVPFPRLASRPLRHGPGSIRPVRTARSRIARWRPGPAGTGSSAVHRQTAWPGPDNCPSEFRGGSARW